MPRQRKTWCYRVPVSLIQPQPSVFLYPSWLSGVPGSSCHNNKEFSIIVTKRFHPFIVFDTQFLPTPHLL